MRGDAQAKPDFLTVINLTACVTADHPLRAIKSRLDAVLHKLSPRFDGLCEELDRPSIPPEQLLKARALTVLYPEHDRSAELALSQVSGPSRPALFWWTHPDGEPARPTRRVHVPRAYWRTSAGGEATPVAGAHATALGRSPGHVGRGQGLSPERLRPRVSRARGLAPHVACKARVEVSRLDGRTTRHSGYQVSQRLRKQVEEIFGWMTTAGCLSWSRYRGRERTQAWDHFVAGTYNLLRLELGRASSRNPPRAKPPANTPRAREQTRKDHASNGQTQSGEGGDRKVKSFV